jgi:hypothetical protein
MECRGPLIQNRFRSREPVTSLCCLARLLSHIDFSHRLPFRFTSTDFVKPSKPSTSSESADISFAAVDELDNCPRTNQASANPDTHSEG